MNIIVFMSFFRILDNYKIKTKLSMESIKYVCRKILKRSGNNSLTHFTTCTFTTPRTYLSPCLQVHRQFCGKPDRHHKD